MAKLIKKNKCEFKHGSILKKNEQIGLPFIIWAQLTKLETMTQEYLYLKSQPKYTPAPSLDGFERKSALKADLPYIEKPETPVTDKRVAEAMEFIAEADAMTDAAVINSTIDDFAALIKWCDDPSFIEGDCFNPIDLYELGNPLELKPDTIVRIIKMIVKSPVEYRED